METFAVGFFDGVHLGHQKILRGASTALTFRNHPLSLLAPGLAPRLIMTPEERLQAIRACGVGQVTMIDFTRLIADMSPAEFLERHVIARRGSRSGGRIRCGENWRFGKGGLGDADFARTAGVEVEVVSYAEYKGDRISSTRIRASLENGEIEDATAMMGRRYKVVGQRSEGKGLGRRLGFPTINLRLFGSRLTGSASLRLPLGVYEVEIDGAKGIANYGVAPTMGAEAWQEPVMEVHLLGPLPSAFDLLPSSVAVEVVRFLRPERRFSSVEELRRQIAEDCATVCVTCKSGTETRKGKCCTT